MTDTADQTDHDRAESVRMIRDSAGAIALDTAGLERIRKLRFQPPGFDPAVWQQMGELGWIGLRLGEERGGIGLGMVEACALAEELGRGLVPEPLIPGAVSAGLLAAVGEEALLARLLAGEVFVATAWQEEADSLATPGSSDRRRLFIPMGAGAGSFLVPVREGQGLALHLLPAEGQRIDMRPTQDGGHIAALHPDLAQSVRIGVIGNTLPRLLDEAALGTAAYLLGLMSRAFELTLDYLRTRQQFGKQLGSFQALQHRAANLHIQIVLSRASLEAAAAELDAGAEDRRRQAVVSRAKSRAAEAALLVTREAIQMHGAIGYTDEYDIGLFLRKAMVLMNQFGSPALHRQRFVATSPSADD
jgi:alkylation response protein AidB-like acyl-CoA dehydrogenase